VNRVLAHGGRASDLYALCSEIVRGDEEAVSARAQELGEEAGVHASIADDGLE
jgi:hypothetical protein